jgi:iron complex outermembrane receptor protein
LSASQAQLDLTTGKQIDVGLKQQLIDNRLEWTLALYDIVKEDLLTEVLSTPDPDDVAQIGEQSSRVVEISLAYTIKDQWHIDANATVLDAEYDSFGTNTGNTPDSVAEELANVWGSWQFVRDWRARAGLRYVGKRYLDPSNATELPSYTVLGAALDWAASDALTVSAHVRNAMDETYAQASYGPQFISVCRGRGSCRHGNRRVAKTSMRCSGACSFPKGCIPS